MAEFDYEVVDGRKIRVRPQEVVSEIDEKRFVSDTGIWRHNEFCGDQETLSYRLLPVQ